jgi:hypothetical protein
MAGQAGILPAQEKSSAPEPAEKSQVPAQAPASPPAPPTWSVGPIDFSGSIDGYYEENFNHPRTPDNYRYNQLRNFDVKADQFSLNLAKISLAHTPDPVGFQLDFGFGRAFEIIHSSEKGPEIFRYLEQAYVSLKPPKAGGLQLDFGKFVTSAGAEVIETQNNWNYSRSLLFSWGIPYYHFGLRANMPLSKHFSAGVQLVNGWNNVEDNNTGKTVGLTAAITSSKVTWSHNYYVGPEKTDTDRGIRQLYDTTLLLTPKDQFSAYINFDYGTEKRLDFARDHWVGVAVAARMAPTSHFAITPRIEWFNDANGFSTGTTQKLKEFTLTGEYKMAEGLLTRLEYRHDWSNVAFFDRGLAPAASKDMNTVALGIVAYFGPKR